MGNVHASITPRGIKLKDEIDLMYMILYSLNGICAKLDADGGVTGTTYKANCITALINLIIRDSKGNRFANVATPTSSLEPLHIIGPAGISEAARQAFLYQVYNCIKTLTTQLDADGTVNGTTFKANVYTALILDRVQNKFGSFLGNGTTFTYRRGGMSARQWQDSLYSIIDAIETLTEQLDADSGVTDTTYESLWFTATILLMIENSKGSKIGVARSA